MEGESPEKVRVFDYLDYRTFLREFYQFSKRAKRGFSYRKLALKARMDPGYFTHVLKGERTLNLIMAGRLAVAMGLNTEEKDFFETLVLYGQAKSPAERNPFHDKILRMRAAKVHTLEQGQLEYFRTWYYAAIRELLNFFPFLGDFGKLAARLQPPIKPAEAKRALAFLERSGMVEKGADGAFRLAHSLVSSGERILPEAVNTLHRSMAELAIRAIDGMDPMERDFSSLTLSMSEQGMDVVKAKLRKFRKEVMELADQEKAVDRVYQMNFQVFPLSSRSEGSEGG